MYRLSSLGLAGLCLVAMAPLASADATFEMSQPAGTPGGYQVSDGVVRVRAAGPQGQNTVILYDTRSDSMVQINDQRQLYAVMDRAGMQQLSSACRTGCGR